MPRFVGHLRCTVGSVRLDVQFETQGRLAVIGPNGAGKSSLLKALIGALAVEEGRIAVGEKCLLDTRAHIDVPMEERRIGYLPQSYALFPHLTVEQNVAFPMVGRIASRQARSERAAALLENVGVAQLAQRRASKLSGGEMQRVALARALASEPEVLLLDEPLAAMDVGHRQEVQSFLVSHLTDLALPMLVVTHDAAEAQALGEEILVLESGRVTQRGTFAELVNAPATAFVAQFTRGDAAHRV